MSTNYPPYGQAQDEPGQQPRTGEDTVGGAEAEDAEEAARRERIEAGIAELRAHLAEVQESLKTLAGEVVDAGRQAAASYEDAVRHAIERQPYTSVLIAALVGFVLGSFNSQGRR